MLNRRPNTLLMSLLTLLYLGRMVGSVSAMYVAEVLLFFLGQTHFMLCRCGNMISANGV